MMRLRSLALVLVLLTPVLATAATVQVDQVGLTFVPNDITINVGDTVEWVWSSGIHTVTNGTGAADPNVGTLFDAPFSSGTFSFTFNSAGDVPYFCRPHEGFGMTGIVRVQGATPVPTLSEWALIVGSALLLLTGFMATRRQRRVPATR